MKITTTAPEQNIELIHGVLPTINVDGVPLTVDIVQQLRRVTVDRLFVATEQNSGRGPVVNDINIHCCSTDYTLICTIGINTLDESDDEVEALAYDSRRGQLVRVLVRHEPPSLPNDQAETTMLILATMLTLPHVVLPTE